MKITYCVLVIVLLVVKQAAACSCMTVPLAQEHAQAKRIVIGRIVGRTIKHYTPNLPNGSDYPYPVVEYRVKVKKAYKGDRVKRFKITTAKDGAACGVRFKLGRTYLIYGFADERYGLYTTLCNRNFSRKDADYEKEVALLESINN